MSSLFLSRVRLKPDPSMAALAPILVSGGRLAPHAGKALVWSLFADQQDRRRDFLWRWDGWRPGRLAGEFLILSARPPANHHNLFDLETKKFGPRLAQGEALTFRLRANPVVRKPAEGRQRPTKHDIVMDGLRRHEKGARADVRWTIIAESGLAWIQRQLGKAGAELHRDSLRVDGYEQHHVPNGKGKGIDFSSLDFDGLLTVMDPDRFVAAVTHGFGASKAYGCGLMLIKRA